MFKIRIKPINQKLISYYRNTYLPQIISLTPNEAVDFIEKTYRDAIAQLSITEDEFLSIKPALSAHVRALIIIHKSKENPDLFNSLISCKDKREMLEIFKNQKNFPYKISANLCEKIVSELNDLRQDYRKNNTTVSDNTESECNSNEKCNGEQDESASDCDSDSVDDDNDSDDFVSEHTVQNVYLTNKEYINNLDEINKKCDEKDKQINLLNDIIENNKNQICQLHTENEKLTDQCTEYKAKLEKIESDNNEIKVTASQLSSLIVDSNDLITISIPGILVEKCIYFCSNRNLISADMITPKNMPNYCSQVVDMILIYSLNQNSSLVNA